MKLVRKTPVLVFAAALAALTLAPSAWAQTAPKANPATVPATRNTWLDLHNRQKREGKQAKPEVAFVGDSITAGWNGSGRKVWQTRIAPLKAANYGIGGDRTEHVLWRLQNGAFEGISPKVVVLMIGTNNTWRDKPEDIAEGVSSVVDEIQKRAPQAKILLLAVFPRSEKPTDERRLQVAEVNKLLVKLEDGKKVFFQDIGSKFLEPDGTLSKAIMPDYLHLSEKGYTIWADAVLPKVQELLK